MDQLSRNKEILAKYIPGAAVDIIAEWVYRYNFKLRIKKSRSSKYGDYRPPVPGENHLITINYDLNKYAFLITLIHEIAHLSNFNKHKNNVKPHGTEWKNEYKELMKLFLNENIFPQDIALAIQTYMKNPAASSCSDLNLQRTLRKYNEKESQTVHLEKLPHESIFKIEKERYFIKGVKLRKRFLCTELDSKRKYLFNPLAEVLLVTEKQADNISQ